MPGSALLQSGFQIFQMVLPGIKFIALLPEFECFRGCGKNAINGLDGCGDEFRGRIGCAFRYPSINRLGVGISCLEPAF